MELFIAENKDALSQQAAAWMVNYINKVLASQEKFTLVLSGGSTPAGLYKLLASDAYREKIDWSAIHFFWGDERYVPFSDERNNAKMAWDQLLSKLPVKKEQVHEMKTDLPADASAAAYNILLHEYFGEKATSFDLVLLGMGPDAHTLSLFPGYTDIIDEKEKWATAFWLKEQDMYRITLTAPVVNRAAAVMFLVSGADKAPALNHVLHGEKNIYRYPSQVIAPITGELHWYTDKEAASGLQDNYSV